MVKGEIAHHEQFHLWPQCFQLYLTIKLSFMEIFHVFVTLFSKSSAADHEQFHLWPQCFQLYLTIKLSFMEIFHVFVTLFSKSSAADLLYVEKG